MPTGRVLVYLVRHDLRVSDNPILHQLASAHDHGFTHLLPIFHFEPHQMEVSGFLKEGKQSPYPEAKSRVGGFWRCGPHRARFIATNMQYSEAKREQRISRTVGVVVVVANQQCPHLAMLDAGRSHIRENPLR